MPVRAFANEDGNLQSKTLVSARVREYSDIDLKLERKPAGDIYKKSDGAAVKQAVKNILLTNYSEKPFAPKFGADLNSLLFDLDTEIDEGLMKEIIITAIEDYEPRARVLDIQTRLNSNQNEVDVTVSFQIVNTTEVVSVDISLTRLR
jgi:phage baseplate assembly protein W